VREKRRFKRLDVSLPVTLRCQGRFIPATALNISCGGIFLDLESSDIARFTNDKVEVVVDLSEKERDVALRGEVTRIETSEGSKLGVKFTNLYTVGHQTLERYINKNLH